MSGSIPLGIPTRSSLTTTSSYETTISCDLTSSLIDDDDGNDDFDFYPSIPRRDGMDLDSDPFGFPTSFTYIPLVTKPTPSEVVHPSHRYKVVLRKRHRQAPELQFLPHISEESE